MIGKGFITTCIVTAPQDLTSGKLALTVLVGYLKNIEIDVSQKDTTYTGWIATFQNEFPSRSDSVLNLRNVEQSLEN